MGNIIKQDKYTLSQSPNIQVKNVADEVQLDLALNPSIYEANGGVLFGKVLNTTNGVIQNVSVSLMDLTYTPIYHTFCDAIGNYSIENIKEGSYILFIKAQGYKLYEKNPVLIQLNSTTEINVTLENDVSEQLGVIAGDVLNGVNYTSIYGAVVTLFKLQDVNGSVTEVLQSVSYTNEYGQYAFSELSMGNYRIKVTALGYIKTSSDCQINQSEQVIGLNISIMQDGNIAYGTVSGIIADSNNIPVSGADVILYKIESDNSITPIAFTRTNSSGAYLFINVPDGNYKIISNKTEIITVNISQGVINTL